MDHSQDQNQPIAALAPDAQDAQLAELLARCALRDQNALRTLYELSLIHI